MTSARSKMKMNKVVTQTNVDLYQCPKAIIPPDPNNQLTLGDLHGNAIKLIFALIHGNILALSAIDDYDKLVEIYKKFPAPWAETEELYLSGKNERGELFYPPQEFIKQARRAHETSSDYKVLTEEDLKFVRKIINEATIKDKSVRPALFRLIGDTLADRGANDIYTLLILKKLVDTGVTFEILLSNHDIEFIESYEKEGELEFSSHYTQLFQTASMLALQILIDKKLIDRGEVKELIDKYYKPNLKLLSYALNPDKTAITIYSHAGIGLKTIEGLADKLLGLNYFYDDSTAEKLALTIEDINLAFQAKLNANQVHTLYDPDTMRTMSGGKPINAMDSAMDSPVEFIMWNRQYGSLHRPSKNIISNPPYYKIDFVHGHDSNEETSKNIVNIDNVFGKRGNAERLADISSQESEYSVLETMGRPLTLEEKAQLQSTPTQPMQTPSSPSSIGVGTVGTFFPSPSQQQPGDVSTSKSESSPKGTAKKS